MLWNSKRPWIPVLCLVFTGCAKHEPAANSPSEIHAASELSAQDLAKAATVTCAPGSDCSPSVGLLSYADGNTAGQCSASLVAPDIAITNSHCIPASIKAAGSSCAEKMWLTFVPRSGFETQLECAQVIFASIISYAAAEKRPDYAVIRLKTKSRRPVLDVSREGMAEGEALYLNKVDPNGANVKISGLQMNSACRVVNGSDYFPGAINLLSKLIPLGDCPVVHGNSGSPVLDGNGKMRGVIFLRFEPEVQEQRIATTPGLTLRADHLAPMGLATNFACLKIGQPGEQLNPGCASVEKDLLRSERERAQSAFGAEEEILRHALNSEAAPVFLDFEWKIGNYLAHPEAAELEYAPLPNCIHASALARYEQSVAISRPVWNWNTDFDLYLRPKKTLKEVARANGTIQAHAENGQVTVHLDAEGDTFTANLPVCKN